MISLTLYWVRAVKKAYLTSAFTGLYELFQAPWKHFFFLFQFLALFSVKNLKSYIIL